MSLNEQQVRFVPEWEYEELKARHTALVEAVGVFLTDIKQPGDIEPPPDGLLYVWPSEFNALSKALAVAQGDKAA